jgi:peptide/nickel transport system substrate-binding protein
MEVQVMNVIRRRPASASARRVLALACLALLALTSFAGCGSSSSSSGDQAAGGSPASGKTGGTVVFGNSGYWDGMDPAYRTAASAMTVYSHVFEGLVTRDRKQTKGNPPIVPQLATKWKISPDKKTYTFTLREGVKFHDGTPFDADAVQFNFQRWSDKKFQYYDPVAAAQTASTTAMIKSTRAVDPTTFEIKLKEPNAGLIDRMSAVSYFSFVSPKAIEQYGNEGQLKHGVGTGPFKVVEFSPRGKTVLERNDDYWGTPPKIDRLIFVPILDSAARTAALLSGEVDVIPEVPSDSLESIRNNPQMTVYLSGKPLTLALMPNYREKPFNDPKVRKAVSMAINRKAIAEQLMQGAGTPGTQLYGPGNAGFDESLPIQDEYDPEGAKKLLAEAGYPDGFQTTLPASPGGGGIGLTDQIMQAVQSDLKAVGIDAKLRMKEWNSYVSEWIKGIPTGKGIGAWTMAIGTDDTYVLDMYLASSNQPPTGWNTAYFEDPKADELLNEAARAPNDDKYTELHREAQKVMLADTGYIAIVHDAGPYAVSKRVNWQPARAWIQDLSWATVNQ